MKYPGGRREAAARVLHRLDEDGGHGVGALHLDGAGDALGGPVAVLLGRHAGHAGDLVGAVVVGVGHPDGTRDQRLEHLLEGRDAGDRQGALRGAVVGDLAADDLVLERPAGDLEVLLGEFPRALDGLAAAGGEEDAVEVAGGLGGETLGQLDGLGVRVRPQREERQLLGLLGGGLGQLAAAVTRLDHEEPGEAVEVALAVHVVDVGALTPHDHRHLGTLVRAVPGEVHPQVVLRGLHERGHVGVFRVRHRDLPSLS
ncbi:hypothetical protein GCM10018952_65920 [Streptosporangium vulgare]